MNIILAPVVTEKSVEDMKKGKYAFVVAKGADKPLIKKTVQDSFKVDVLDVATVNIKQRKRRTNQGKFIKEPSFKKAIVKVKEGQKIDIFNIEKK